MSLIEDMVVEPLTETIQSLEGKLERVEQYLLFLGDLCDSPDSLRRNLAETCEFIAKERTARGKTHPKWEGRWREFLAGEE